MEELSDDEVIAAATTGDAFRKPLLIDELARRALADPALLGQAVEAISAERALLSRQGYAPGWMAAGRILDSGDAGAIAVLLRAMDAWSARDQADLVALWSGPAGLAEGTRALLERHGWAPKYDPERR
ncbi:hypothetical protein [Pontivivens ytuae]|uniref:Uncharacterized protein n=1 Tax=Pontivivens ytuae TaxID=2789856 RepID=A0A7S9LSX6_9RHOB|nr:hypothetical protein [Pontivivens ytuae]QPH54613.1 hypothetical protein I0K15_02185 [Pontivivens ytuae]